ncbi:hypothetical protein V6N12_069909 [Hibiscus sabdariffa]|uniref:RNase H type-1 domain-containing protein n=1 Tax=Hibiscus sabdariffa TaxID=183260 RepID=A0ABR2FFT3_9ROSI
MHCNSKATSSGSVGSPTLALAADGWFQIRLTYEGLPKVMTFLWLLCHSRILTNVERARWHMTNNSSCPVCAFPVEDLHHVLCFCHVAHSIWGCFIRQDHLDEFMSLEIKEWIYVNLSNVGGFVLDIADCDVLFGSLLLNLWLRRNEVTFQVCSGNHESILDASIRLQKECLVGRLGDLNATAVVRQATRSMIRWHRPPKGWCKLNNDGVVAASSGDSAYGGVIYNATGDWLIGFNRRLGIFSVLESKLWGIYEGLMTVWSIGIDHLIIEVDNIEALNLIQQYKKGETTLSLVSHIVSMINQQWSFEMNHIMCEGNKLADCMAKFASRDDLICHCFLSPPGSMILQLEEDLHNISVEGG